VKDQLSLNRNQTYDFAQRVRKNLEYIVKKRSEGEDVHEVTQLTISLLGLIVFPWEKHALNAIENKSLLELEKKGWPKWKIIMLDEKKEEPRTLKDLIYHLRNASAHRRLYFSSDAPDMGNVDLAFEDAMDKKSKPYIRIEINASNLKKFCYLFIELIEEYVS
jgi:hypothetical protein